MFKAEPLTPATAEPADFLRDEPQSSSGFDESLENMLNEIVMGPIKTTPAENSTVKRQTKFKECVIQSFEDMDAEKVMNSLR